MDTPYFSKDDKMTLIRGILYRLRVYLDKNYDEESGKEKVSPYEEYLEKYSTKNIIVGYINDNYDLWIG
jgi:hypothetical protein